MTGIGLVAYGQQDPLVAFRRNGYRLFTQMQDTLRHDVISRFFRLEAHSVIADETVLTTGQGKDVSGNRKMSIDSQKKAPRLNRAARRAQERRERKRQR